MMKGNFFPTMSTSLQIALAAEAHIADHLINNNNNNNKH
jgi:hypothetical protein